MFCGPNGPFTQEDPIGIAGGLNLYGYAGSDPINFSDPFGLCPECYDALDRERYPDVAAMAVRDHPKLAMATTAPYAVAALVVLGATAAEVDLPVAALNELSEATDGAVRQVFRRAANAGGEIQARLENGRFARWGENALRRIAGRLKDSFNSTEFATGFANGASGNANPYRMGWSGKLGHALGTGFNLLVKR